MVQKFVTTKEASKISGYTPNYITCLAKSGKILGKKKGNVWQIKKISLASFLRQQSARKTSRARKLARVRGAEYTKHRGTRKSPIHSPLPSILSPLQIPNSTRNVWFREALAISVALLVVSSGAIMAQSRLLSYIAGGITSTADQTAIGFGETFGNVPSNIEIRIDRIREEIHTQIANVAERRVASESIASAVLAKFDLSSIQMPTYTSEGHFYAKNAFLATPAASIGVGTFPAIDFQKIASEAPTFINTMNLALGKVVVDATHAAIGADVAFAYGVSTGAPVIARTAATYIVGVGDLLANATARLPELATALFLRTTAIPASVGPQLAQTLFGAEYKVAMRFVALTNSVAEGYLAVLSRTEVLASNAAEMVIRASNLAAVAEAKNTP